MDQITLERKDEKLVLTLTYSLGDLSEPIYTFLRQLEHLALSERDEVKNTEVKARREFGSRLAAHLTLNSQFAFVPVIKGQLNKHPLLNTFRLGWLPSTEQESDFLIARWTRHDSPPEAHDEVCALEGERQTGTR